MDPIIEYVHDGDMPVFRVTITNADRYTFEGVVDSIDCWEDLVDWVPAEFEDYMEFFFKGDLCGQVTFGNKIEPTVERVRDGRLHICGVEYYARHILLMKELYAMMHRHMGLVPEREI
jgi:hypothetical protein